MNDITASSLVRSLKSTGGTSTCLTDQNDGLVAWQEGWIKQGKWMVLRVNNPARHKFMRFTHINDMTMPMQGSFNKQIMFNGWHTGCAFQSG